MELRRLLVALGLVGVAGGVQAQAKSEPVVRGRVVGMDGRAVAAAEVGLVDSPVRAREQIDRSTAFRTFELLRGISGVQVAWNPPGVPGTTVRFSRCLDFPPRISVWVDGQKIPFRAPAPPPSAGRALTPEEAARGGASLEEVLAWRSATWSQWLELFDFVRPADIEAVEVFRGIGQIPAEFRDDSCAAVAIWTREGGKAPPPGDR